MKKITLGRLTNTSSIDTSTIDIRQALSNFDVPSVRQHQKSINKPNLDHIPGNSGLPLIGNALPMIYNLQNWLNSQQSRHGKVFRVKIPTLDGVMLLGPEANKLLFKNEGKKFSNYLAWEYSLRDLFDNNLLERDFADHKKLRKSLQIAFKRESIEGHIEMMNPMLKDGIKTLPSGKTIKAMDYVKELLLSTGSNVFLGVEPGPEIHSINKAFTDIVAGTADLLHIKQLWFTPFAKGIKGRKTLSDYMLKNIAERRKYQTKDLFSQFCHLQDDNGNLFTDEEIRDQLLFILFAAHDTTTGALSAVLYALATNPQWQEELRQEMHSLDKDDIEFDDIDKMQKTDWTIKEALRMYPPLAVAARYALEDFEYEGHKIPANTPIVYSSLFTHYMPEYWTNPYRFDPMRFSPERAEYKKDFYQYVPFGGGAHKCLGLHFAQVQSKMFLFHLLKNYRISKHPKMTRYKFTSLPLTFPTDGLPLRFTRI